MLSRKLQEYTVDDIYALPEGKRAELMDGVVYDMAPPSTVHQRILTRLVTKINNYIVEKQGTCEVFAAPFAVFLNKDKRNYVEPELLFRRTSITPLIGVKRTSKASQSDLISPKATWNMRSLVAIQASVSI